MYSILKGYHLNNPIQATEGSAVWGMMRPKGHSRRATALRRSAMLAAAKVTHWQCETIYLQD
jgi:hypothetical protein